MRTDDGDETAAEARKKEHAAQKDALVKELFRVTAANGRVTYTVIFKNGEVVKSTSADIYTYVSETYLRTFEHNLYKKGLNNETQYQKRHDMGGWAGGTDQELIKSMNKKIATARRARADKDADQSPEPDTKMSSAEPVVKTPAAKQLPASSIRKRLSRTAALRRSEEDDSSRTATESPRLGPREIPDSVSPEPPKKKARILDKVEVQTLKPPAKQSDLYQFFGSKRKLPEPKAKSPIEDYTDVAFKPTRFQQGKPPDSHTYKVLIRSESRNGSRFKDAFSGAETDDSAAKQLKNESESTKPKEKSGRRITGGQTPGKWSTYSGNKNGKWSSKKSFPRGGSSDDDLLAPGSSHKTPRYPSPRHPSNRQTPIASNRKRRAAPKTMSETAEFEVESIVAHRFVDGRKQYYVKWVNFGPNDNTWEPEENLDGSLGLVEDYESTLVDDL